MIEPLKAWDKERKEMFEVREIDFYDKTVRIGNGVILLWRGFEDVVPIRPTGFHDINGADPSRKLWEGDVLEWKLYGETYYGVIVWRSEYGWWSVADEKGNHRYLYKHARHFKAKYAGNIWEHGHLIPWWEEEK